tara:strand:- start:5524 stop:6900 length:1377 start_codon:yes stop_codon:yes gene_type:complete
MAFYFILALSAALAFGLIRWGRKSFYRLAISSTRVLDIMLGDQDEDEKLEELQSHTGRLILNLLAFIGLLIGAGAIILISLNLHDIFIALEEGEAPPELSSWQSILALSVGATLPFLIPFKKSPSGYSELAMLLHRMVLNNYHLGLKLFRREVKSKGIEKRKDFLIISGLARAGTTSFMNHLATLPQFQSLNYGNMPFLLSPHLWSRFYKPKAGQSRERSHKDGIQLGMNSNEALEEYFFKAISKDSYIKEHCLEEYRLSADAHESYLDYQSIIRQSPDQIYLAKNNNFLLRYRGLGEENSQFQLVLLFRQPLFHAASLRSMHQRYCQMQSEDAFVLEYMNWLGHHEFGLDQKPFLFEGGQLPEGDKSELNYWLQIWIEYYRFALELEGPNIHFTPYEAFCAEPVDYLNRALAAFQLKWEQEAPQAFVNQRKVDLDYDESLYAKALEIYQALELKAQS